MRNQAAALGAFPWSAVFIGASVTGEPFLSPARWLPPNSSSTARTKDRGREEKSLTPWAGDLETGATARRTIPSPNGQCPQAASNSQDMSSCDRGCVCKLRTQDPENFDEEVKSLVSAWRSSSLGSLALDGQAVP